MRRRWYGLLPLGCAALVAAAWTFVRRPVPEIDAMPSLVGLPMVYHDDSRGWEGWLFTGPGKASDVTARLKATLLARGWASTPSSRGIVGFSYSPPRPLGGLLDVFHRDIEVDIARERSDIDLTIESGRIMPDPPVKPLVGEWTTILVNSHHAVLFSGPEPYPFWKVYR